MIPTANVSVQIDEKSVKEYIQAELDKQIHQHLLLIDVNKLSQMTSMSVRYLEDEILSDPRVKVHERKKSRKRWWLYEPTIEAIKSIVDDW